MIETLVMMTVYSTVLGGVSVALFGALRLEQRFRDRSDVAGALDRLAMQFRQDAHAADSAEAPPGGATGQEEGDIPLVILRGPDNRRINYRSTAQGVWRQVLKDEEVVHRDGFLLGKDAVVRGEFDSSREEKIVTLVVSHRNQGATTDASLWMRIEAAVGLHGPPVHDK